MAPGLKISESKICPLVFGVAFWNIARTVGYERNIKIYMIISGWGIFLIFAANQAAIQIVNPYPPFGLVTLTVLTTAGYLILNIEFILLVKWILLRSHSYT